MIDPLTSLAFSVFNNKGVYALLLGSGVSRAAGIPTGWDVVLDLIGQVAAAEGVDPGPAPEHWYEEMFGETPGYSSLLSNLAKTQTERSQLIKQYFEPTQEEREQGLKQPTPVHMAIADLVAGGYIRVILTTNFDHLIEHAIRAKGIEPTVIWTPDGIEGALPLAHAGVTIYKLNGDYLDTRSMNTQDELATLDPRMDKLLDRVFDEFGIVVCGWSAEWDLGLRLAFERCQSRRFTVYWSARSRLKDAAQHLVTQRDAVVVSGLDADTFFQRLADRVVGLEEYAQPHPLSVAAAVATVKRYLAEDRFRIRLFDLVMDEAGRLHDELSAPTFSFHSSSRSDEAIRELVVQRVHLYEGHSTVLLAMMTTGCFWSGPQPISVWKEALTRVGSQSRDWNGLTVLMHLSLYPMLLLLYGGGIAATAAGRYEVLSSLFDAPVKTPNANTTAGAGLNPWVVIQKGQLGRMLPGMERRFTPLSDHLQEILRDPLRTFLNQDEQYTRCFDRFEYLLGLVHVDQRIMSGRHVWGPLGSFAWRNRGIPEETTMQLLEQEIDKFGSDWPPLKVGLFGGSINRLKKSKQKFDQFIGSATASWI